MLITIAVGSVVLLVSWAFLGNRGMVLAAVTVEGEVFSLFGGNDAETEAAAETEQGKYADILNNPELMAQQNIYTITPAAEGEVSLVFAGDILFDDGYSIMAKMKSRGQGIEGSIDSGLLGVMRDADIFMVNNEFTYTKRGAPTRERLSPSGPIRPMRRFCMTWGQIWCPLPTTTPTITARFP